jgi:cobalt/nickel transport system permease protein
MLFLALTTPVSEWLGLVRHPALREIGDLAHLVYRFVFAFFRTAQTIRTAQEARNGHRTRWIGIRSMGLLSARLLVRALDRVRGMEMGLAARGYDGTVKLLSRQNRICWGTMAGFLMIQLAVILFLIWYRGAVHVG